MRTYKGKFLLIVNMGRKSKYADQVMELEAFHKMYGKYSGAPQLLSETVSYMVIISFGVFLDNFS